MFTSLDCYRLRWNEGPGRSFLAPGRAKLSHRDESRCRVRAAGPGGAARGFKLAGNGHYNSTNLLLYLTQRIAAHSDGRLHVNIF